MIIYLADTLLLMYQAEVEKLIRIGEVKEVEATRYLKIAG